MSYYCYLINSNKYKNSSKCYIGFTTTPKRRIRQHNGEITNGAKKTSIYRPWKYILIISGFTNKIIALQFEWQFQYPFESRIVRNNLNINKKYSYGWKGKLQILSIILQIKLWKQLHLKVHFFDETIYNWYHSNFISKNNSTEMSYVINYVHSIDEIPNYDIHKDDFIYQNNNNNNNNQDKEDKDKDNDQDVRLNCSICSKSNDIKWKCIYCNTITHLTCTIQYTKQETLIIPTTGQCNICQHIFHWCDIVRSIIRQSRKKNHQINQQIEGNDNLSQSSESDTFQSDNENEVFDGDNNNSNDNNNDNSNYYDSIVIDE